MAGAVKSACLLLLVAGAFPAFRRPVSAEKIIKQVPVFEAGRQLVTNRRPGTTKSLFFSV
jgi:hypothetical protein